MIELLRTSGTELDLVNVSRVCTGREGNPANVAKAIRNLVKLKHWSVFEHASMSFRIKAPIYVMRQWMRHDGAWMEKSRRYTKDELTFGEFDGDHAKIINDTYRFILEYKKPEDARKSLPLDLMTECIWTADLRTIFHFLRLRLDSHTQSETRELAKQVALLVIEHYPNVWDAFVEYDFTAITITDDDANSYEFVEAIERGQESLRYNRATIEEIVARAQNSEESSGQLKLALSDSP